MNTKSKKLKYFGVAFILMNASVMFGTTIVEIFKTNPILFLGLTAALVFALFLLSKAAKSEKEGKESIKALHQVLNETHDMSLAQVSIELKKAFPQSSGVSVVDRAYFVARKFKVKDEFEERLA